MEIFPRNLGTRPRLAAELRPEGVVAARADDAAGLLTTVAAHPLDPAALAPGLHAGNLMDRAQVVAALRSTLDSVARRSGDRGRPITLIVPDAAVRVLLLDFDALSAKPAEALAVIRFRLKKLLPFDSEHAALSYQVMTSDKNSVRVLAVAMPHDVLSEYEDAVAAAGYTAGAVLPSTLAALAGLEEQASPVLMVNAGHGAVTTAIAHGSVLLLHRFLELADDLPLSHAPDESVALPPLDSADARIAAEISIESNVLASVEAAMAGREISQAVSVAAAYFEDMLGAAPDRILSAGTLTAEALRSILEGDSSVPMDVREIVGPEALAADAATGAIARSWLAGVRGALRN
jgi:type IV pilus assembly protein PilM